jgi:hypothetical protein
MSLEKVTIEAWQNKRMTGKVVKTFKLSVNPESYTQNFKIEHDKRQGQGGQRADSRYHLTNPAELRLNFFLDGTHTIEGYGNEKKYAANDATKPDNLVEDELKDFLDTVYFIDGEIHRPTFLQITWGTLHFTCILKNLDLNYTLFKGDGKPLRIKVAATFLQYVPKEESDRKAKLKSPDLTRIRNAQQGERLDLMVSEIYSTPQYVLQIAKANNLSSIRQLKPGQELRFPPLDKTEN